jgi:hypothetical protein
MNLAEFKGPKIDCQGVEDERFVSFVESVKRTCLTTCVGAYVLRHDLANEAELPTMLLWAGKATASIFPPHKLNFILDAYIFPIDKWSFLHGAT